MYNLQSLQNSAVHVLTRTREQEHNTLVLKPPHWLPMRFRIEFKVPLLVFKRLNGVVLTAFPLTVSDLLLCYHKKSNSLAKNPRAADTVDIFMYF